MPDHLPGDAVAPRVLLVIILAVAAITAAAATRADDAIMDAVGRCATIDAAKERLACYDQIAGPSHAAPVAPSVAAAAPVAEPASAPAPAARPVAGAAGTLDDIDAETKPKAAREEQEELLVRARVTRCEKDARKKYYFVFENEQVWKQVSDKRLTYRECDFEVTITKDFFGYKMQPDGEKGRIRIVRVK
jgi:hypothetical protein